MVTGATSLLTSGTSSDKKTLFGALGIMMREHLLNTDKMLPAEVVSFDRTNNLAVVQPLISRLDVDDNQLQRHEVSDIPVLSIGGGAFHVSFPIVKGNIGWIFAADRDMALFKQSLAMAPPSNGRSHSFSDGLFIPDVFRQYVINGEDAEAMVIQSTDGATRISIRADNIKITAPSKVTVDVPLSEFTGNVTIDKNLIVTGNATVTGATAVNGGFDATGGSAKPCALPADATIGGISVSGHGHISESPGNRTGGGMIA